MGHRYNILRACAHRHRSAAKHGADVFHAPQGRMVVATAQGRRLEASTIAAAMTWADPDRDVALPCARALSLLEQGHTIHCVWSGKRLMAERLDVDHCSP